MAKSRRAPFAAESKGHILFKEFVDRLASIFQRLREPLSVNGRKLSRQLHFVELSVEVIWVNNYFSVQPKARAVDCSCVTKRVRAFRWNACDVVLRVFRALERVHGH